MQARSESGLDATIMAIAPTAMAAVAGSLATMPEIPTWYASLAKPAFTPPNWLFGPAWTTLYILMAIAFWRILRLPTDAPGVRGAIGLWIVQIVLNALWSFAFFRFHSPLAGLVVIALLWVAIALTLVRFYTLDRIAGLLFVPYLAWVTFASALNFAIWRLN
ncbi:MAG: tryptophan-rich sensory protein [Hyphomicrobiales bacterium]|nr:tryptophan-rich sensory protein [Hyphomicrobiales bacterium]